MIFKKLQNKMEELEENYFEDEELHIPRINREELRELAEGDTQKAKAFRFHIGMRNIKTALAATLCALLYLPINRNPTFACIGAIFGMGRDLSNSKVSGGNRLFGTIIGGFIGMLLFHFYIHVYPDGGLHPLLYVFLFVGIIYMVILCQTLVIPGAIQPAGVVLCIILFNTPVDSYISYSLNRIFDTAIGVVIALIINVVLARENIDKVKEYIDKLANRSNKKENKN